MSVLFIFILNTLLLMMSIVLNYFDMRPYSEKLRHKYRVKRNSIFRKIIKFKDEKLYQCNYFKIVPIYIYIVIFIFSFVLFIIDLITGFYISHNYETIIMTTNGIILLIAIIYLIVIIIWWGIVDEKEFKKDKKMIAEFIKLNKKQKTKEKSSSISKK